MNKLKNLFLFKKKVENKKGLSQSDFVQYEEIAKLVKEARIKQSITIEYLSRISKIPEKTITSIEENNQNFIPKYPFIRSILIKLEECLALKKNTLVKFATSEVETFKKVKQNFIMSKLDLINSWQGTILYFFILILTLFIIKRYFILNVNIIEIQNIEKKSLKNNIQ
tara:strand:+ start:601 stop:1104 length:504 start_codon:yes stop_codon:yes gene_type:complete